MEYRNEDVNLGEKEGSPDPSPSN